MKKEIFIILLIIFLNFTVSARTSDRQCEKIFSKKIITFQAPYHTPAQRMFISYLERVLKISDLDELYREVLGSIGNDYDKIWTEAVKVLNLDIKSYKHEIKRIPKKNGLVIASNHPYGGMEAIVLAHLVSQVRNDYKFLVNSMLTKIPAIRDHVIPVEIMNQKSKKDKNKKAVQEAIEHVKNGGVLIIFPAGEVSVAKPYNGLAVDSYWKHTVGKIIKEAGAKSLPVFFDGQNELPFQLANAIHPFLKTLLLPRELVNKKNKAVVVRLGSIVTPEIVEDMNSYEITEYLRHRVYSLGGDKFFRPKNNFSKDRDLKKIHSNLDRKILRDDYERLNKLESSEILFEKDDLKVLLVKGKDLFHKNHISPFMLELSRLREEVFRGVGEGSTNSYDSDKFDLFYDHVVAFDEKNNKIAGAYRIGKGDEILKKYGAQGFYSNQQFKYEKAFFESLEGEVLDLGRSFVVDEYREKGVLLFLWKAVFQFVLKNPQYRHLIGPVSISGEFSELSKFIITQFLMSDKFSDKVLSNYITSTTPYYPSVEIPETYKNLIINKNTTMDHLQRIVKDIDPDMDFPPLIIHYFNILKAQALKVDEDRFFNTVDILIKVDTRSIPRSALKRLINNKDDLERFMNR